MTQRRRWAYINEKEEVREKLCLTRSMTGDTTASKKAQFKPEPLCLSIHLKEILYLVCIIERTFPHIVGNLGWKVPPQ